MSKMTEKEYRTLKALSYSFLKAMEFSPQVIVNGMPEMSSSGLTLGSLVDNIMTGDNYDRQDDFIISKYGLDTNGKTSIDQIIAYLIENKDYSIEEQSMVDLADKLGLWVKMSRENRVKRIFCDKFNEQYQLISAIKEGKGVISEDDFRTAMQMIDTLKTHRFSRDWFLPPIGGEILYQVAIVFRINGVKCKSLLDQIYIDHINKKIYPNDLKTGAEKNFLNNFNRYKYYLQGAMYSLAIDQWKLENGYDDYEVQTFKFIYISRASPNVPFVYEMDSDFILDHINGFTNIYGEYEKGIINLVEDYQWYIENEIYDITRTLHESNGNIVLRNNKK